MREVLPLEPMLTRFLQRNWRNDAEIADLRQEAYARIFEAAQRERPALVKPFLFQVARNLMINRLRKQSVVSLETMADFDWLNVSDDKPSAESSVTARQELRLLQAALDSLPPRCRQVVVMRKVEGLSQKRGCEADGDHHRDRGKSGGEGHAFSDSGVGRPPRRGGEPGAALQFFQKVSRCPLTKSNIWRRLGWRARTVGCRLRKARS